MQQLLSDHPGAECPCVYVAYTQSPFGTQLLVVAGLVGAHSRDTGVTAAKYIDARPSTNGA